MVLSGLLGAALAEALGVHVAHVRLHAWNPVQKLLEIRIIGIHVLGTVLSTLTAHVRESVRRGGGVLVSPAAPLILQLLLV